MTTDDTGTGGTIAVAFTATTAAAAAAAAAATAVAAPALSVFFPLVALSLFLPYFLTTTSVAFACT